MQLPSTLIAKVQGCGQEIASQCFEHRHVDGRSCSLESVAFCAARVFVTAFVLALIAHLKAQGKARPSCSRCGKSMCSRGEEQRSLSLAYGEDIRFGRELFECSRCRKTSAPLDEALGLRRDSWSPLLRQFCCLGAALLPGERAADFLARLLGRRVARRTLMEVAEKEGASEAAVQAAQGTLAKPYRPEKQQRWYVMLDGSASHVDGDWHEAQLGVVFPEDARVETGHGKKRRYRLKWKRVFGCIRNWETCGQILTQVLSNLRLPELASQIIVITDGAPTLRALCALVLPEALQILDWYHVTEHLWTCAKVLYGEGTLGAQRWAKKYERKLYRGQVLKVLAALEVAKRHHRGKKAQQALSDLIRYYGNHVDRMAYDVYRKQGLLIGSGPIEGAHRHIHHQRFKLAGMRHWDRERKNALLNLRLIYLNGDWDAYWSPSTGSPSSSRAPK